jgi:CRP-like cAMP-binding protein
MLVMEKADYERILKNSHDVEGAERVAFVAELPFLNNCTTREVQRLSSILTRKTFLPNTVIFKQGEPSDSVYFIYSGEVRVIQGMEVIKEHQKSMVPAAATPRSPPLITAKHTPRPPVANAPAAAAVASTSRSAVPASTSPPPPGSARPTPRQPPIVPTLGLATLHAGRAPLVKMQPTSSPSAATARATQQPALKLPSVPTVGAAGSTSARTPVPPLADRSLFPSGSQSARGAPQQVRGLATSASAHLPSDGGMAVPVLAVPAVAAAAAGASTARRSSMASGRKGSMMMMKVMPPLPPPTEYQLVDLGLLGPRQFFGEVGVLNSAKRSASVFAKTKVEVFILSAGDFLARMPESARTYFQQYQKFYPTATDSVRLLAQQNKWSHFKASCVTPHLSAPPPPKKFAF